MRAISGTKRHESCSKNYKDLKIIKLKDMLYINIAKFVWDFEKKQVPEYFQNYFKYAKSVHHHNTRYARRNKFSKTNKNCTKRHGIMSFKNLAINISNALKDNDWFNSVKSKISFIKKLKSVILSSY